MAKHLLNAKKTGKRAGPNITFPQLAAAGASLALYDSGGNLLPGPLDLTKTSVAWISSDDTVILIHVHDPSRPDLAELHSTGKVGTGVTVTATFTNLDGSAPIPPAVSDGIDVPAGPPATASIVIGTPA